ncbi:hypothetical protein [Paenibacillus sp. Soil750]|nr:hypothetical protein [Paenibacillus sp. Soil750]
MMRLLVRLGWEVTGLVLVWGPGGLGGLGGYGASVGGLRSLSSPATK